MFYSKIKGELEYKITELDFDSYIIFRPGFLIRENTDRPDERITAFVLKIVNSFGLFQNFKPLPTAILAQKMAKAPKILGHGIYQIVLEKIFSF